MDPQQTVTTPDPAPTVAGAPPVETPPEDLAVEVERAGTREKMVPISALHQEREARGKMKTELETTQGRLSQLEQQLQAVMPVFDLVKQNPALLSQVQEGRVPTRTEPNQEDLEAAEFAREMDLYDGHGQLDLVRAKRMIARETARIQRAIAPVQQATAQQQASANYQWALQQRDPDGQPYARPETIQRVFGMVTPDLAADPRVAQTLLDQAIAMDLRAGHRRTVQPALPPLHSETAGMEGAPAGTAPMSPFDEAVMKARGLSPEEYRKRSQQFNREVR